jgi:hypothetical protein
MGLGPAPFSSLRRSVLLRPRIQIVEAVGPVGGAPGSLATQVKLPQKLSGSPQVFSCSALVYTPTTRLGVRALKTLHAVTQLGDGGHDF